MNLLQQLWDKLCKRNPVRKVWLVLFDGKLVIADAVRTESGWTARWIGRYDQWTILLPDGKVIGTQVVKGWLPHTGDLSPLDNKETITLDNSHEQKST